MSSTEILRDGPSPAVRSLLIGGATLAFFAALTLAAIKPNTVLQLYALGLVGILGLAGLMRPDLYLLAITAVMAIRPEVYLNVIGGVEGQSWYKLLYLGILILYAFRHGVQKAVNWPLFAMAAIAFYSLFNPNPYPALDSFQIIKSFFGLAAGYVVFSLIYRPQDVRRIIWVIALLPVLSVVGGLIETALGMGRMLQIDPISNVMRLQGGTIPAYLASLCLTGFIAALNEALLDRRRIFWVLAAANLAILLATLGRMPLALCMLYSASMLLFLPFRVLGLERRVIIVLAGSFALSLLVLIFADALISRFTGSGSPGDAEGGALNFMGRMLYWELGWAVLEPSPIIGRGMGTGIIFMLDERIPGGIRAPHNEYLRLLVDGGIVGLGLFLAAVLVLVRRQTRRALPEIRVMMWTAILCLAIFSFTDNAITAPTSLPFFLYLAVLLQRLPPGDDQIPEEQRVPAAA